MTFTWRDLLTVHPACDAFDMMSDEDIKALGKDIKKNGLKHPIVVWSETPDSNKTYLLDGRNRLAAMEAAGVPIVRDTWRGAGVRDLVVPYHHMFGEGGGFHALDGVDLTADPFAFVVSVNVHRRHLTAEQKRNLIALALKAKPEASNREIAKQVKSDHKAVGRVRKALEPTGAMPQLPKTIGADGKARTTKPKRAPAPAKRDEPPAAEAPHQIDIEELIAATPPWAPKPVPAGMTLIEQRTLEARQLIVVAMKEMAPDEQMEFLSLMRLQIDDLETRKKERQQ